VLFEYNAPKLYYVTFTANNPLTIAGLQISVDNVTLVKVDHSCKHTDLG